MFFRLGKTVLSICSLLLTAVLLAGSVPSVSYARKTTAQQIQEKEEQKEELEEQI